MEARISVRVSGWSWSDGLCAAHTVSIGGEEVVFLLLTANS
jgi:hypothetical protein